GIHVCKHMLYNPLASSRRETPSPVTAPPPPPVNSKPSDAFGVNTFEDKDISVAKVNN
ncbi:hypothetical protein L9F63_002107, partial [Diploptera punctata]